MKKNFLFFFLIATWTSSSACDICNVYTGITPTDFRNSVGFQYRSRYLKGEFPTPEIPQVRHAAHYLDTSVRKGKEIFNVAELRVRIFAGKKKEWNHLFILPLVNNYRSLNGYTQTDVYGLGDPLFISTRVVAATKKESDRMHRLSLGGGFKLPLGNRNLAYKGVKSDIDMQGSTGSLDVILMLDYIGKADEIGWMNVMSYKINTKGSEGYRYGNTFNWNLMMFYQWKPAVGKVLMPHYGFVLEKAAFDHEGSKISSSGGTVGMLDLGLDFFSNNSRFTFNYQPGLFSAMNGQQFPLKNRFIFGWTFNL
jgi:hypothetical protein